MAANRKHRDPPRPLALANTPAAWWDGEFWRDGPDGEYWYDEATAAKAARFFPQHLKFTEGEWAGRPFVLEAWQEHDIVRPTFGWKRADGTRRYRRVFVWVARKNGKTELAAGIALLMLLGDNEPGAQVFSIASEKEQASIVFNKATTMVAYSPTLSGVLETLKPSIYCPQVNGSFRPLSGRPAGKHGLNMSGLVGDEIHEWKSGDLYVFIHDSGAARRQPLEILISTAGVKGSYGEEVWDECQAIAAGEINDLETLVVVYAAAENDDWTDPTTWARANPNLGVSVKLDTLAADCRRAQQLPRLENDFKRYRLNMWTEQAVRWLPMDGVDDEGRRFGWDHCAGPVSWKDLEPQLVGKRCFGGLDLSSTTDISALVWYFPVQDGLDTATVLARFWKPAAYLTDHGKRDKIDYAALHRQGALFVTPGNVVDYEFIREQIYQDCQRFKVAFQGETNLDSDKGGLAIDRWNAVETATKLLSEGVPVVMFGQGFASMSAPAKALEAEVLANGVRHGGHPLLRRHAQAVAIETDPAGNIKPAKNKSNQRVDGIVALVMAKGIAARDTGGISLEAAILARGGLI